MKKFLFDTVKGALGAALAAGIIAFFQYMGAHIGELPTGLSMWASSHFVISKFNSYAQTR